MEYIELLTVLMTIVFFAKIIAKLTQTVDILWYIILGLIGTQYVFNNNILIIVFITSIEFFCCKLLFKPTSFL